MALKQETIALNRTDENGNKVLQMPITRAENVEGIEFLPVGTIIPFGGNTVPTGYLTCNGAEVSRTTYADLFAIIGTTYGTGNGSTTFNLPNLNNNSFLEGSDTAGTVKSAGLPNITGNLTASLRRPTNGSRPPTGAFYETGATQSSPDDLNYPYPEVGFNANRCSSVYRDDITTVQPKSVTVKFCIKY